jgi:D-alanyl-D-alanine dipeptidase
MATKIRIPWLLGPLLGLAAAGCSSGGPPREDGRFRPADLVELTALDPGIRLDVRYATARNFLGRPVYREARAFLQRPAAEALARVQKAVLKDGYTLIVFDGYRPWSVTRVFWDATAPEKRGFVADPSQGSKHNRGCAVDLTLGDAATGRELEMPSPYDDFTDKAHPNYAGGSAESRRLRDYLRRAMEAEGFAVYELEWWHFDHRDWKEYRILDIDFADIPPGGWREG